MYYENRLYTNEIYKNLKINQNKFESYEMIKSFNELFIKFYLKNIPNKKERKVNLFNNTLKTILESPEQLRSIFKDSFPVMTLDTKLDFINLLCGNNPFLNNFLCISLLNCIKTNKQFNINEIQYFIDKMLLVINKAKTHNSYNSYLKSNGDQIEKKYTEYLNTLLGFGNNSKINEFIEINKSDFISFSNIIDYDSFIIKKKNDKYLIKFQDSIVYLLYKTKFSKDANIGLCRNFSDNNSFWFEGIFTSNSFVNDLFKIIMKQDKYFHVIKRDVYDTIDTKDILLGFDFTFLINSTDNQPKLDCCIIDKPNESIHTTDLKYYNYIKDKNLDYLSNKYYVSHFLDKNELLYEFEIKKIKEKLTYEILGLKCGKSSLFIGIDITDCLSLENSNYSELVDEIIDKITSIKTQYPFDQNFLIFSLNKEAVEIYNDIYSILRNDEKTNDDLLCYLEETKNLKLTNNIQNSLESLRSKIYLAKEEKRYCMDHIKMDISPLIFINFYNANLSNNNDDDFSYSYEKLFRKEGKPKEIIDGDINNVNNKI